MARLMPFGSSHLKWKYKLTPEKGQEEMEDEEGVGIQEMRTQARPAKFQSAQGADGVEALARKARS